jgi:Ni/Co efflux regulator RcnB
MRLIASSLMAGLIAFSSVAPAFADQRGRGHNDRGHNDRGRDRDRDYRDNRRDDRRDDRRWDDRRWDDRRDHHRGYWDTRGNNRDWRRGDNFWNGRHRESHYVVFNDYNRYRLPPPRHGQRYYRDNDTGEILLIAAATGLVLWALTQ